jgi:hypothetical protein
VKKLSKKIFLLGGWFCVKPILRDCYTTFFSDSATLDKLVPPFHLPNLADSNATLSNSRPNPGTTNSHGFTLVGESGFYSHKFLRMFSNVAGGVQWATCTHQAKAALYTRKNCF